MAFNGSGTFNRLYNWATDKSNGVKVRADRTDAEMDGFATGLSNCMTRDGQSPPTADIPMNGKKLTGLGVATLGTDGLSQDAGDARYFELDDIGPLTDIASASTCDIGAQERMTLRITGTTTITSLGTSADKFKIVQTASALTFTYNATSLDLPGNASITTEAGDWLGFQSNSSGNWRCVFWSRQNGKAPIAHLASEITSSATGSIAATTVQAALAELDTEKAPLASPTLTGTPAAPTASASTDSTQIATTAFVWDTLGAPSGTRMLFQQTAAPLGWTKDTTHNNKALRLTSGTVSSGGSVAFTTAFANQALSGTVGNTTLTTSQIPSHSHGPGTLAGTAASNGAHTHFTVVNLTENVTLSASNSLAYFSNNGNDQDYTLRGYAGTPTIGETSSDGAHTHTVSLASGTSDTAGTGGSHTHSLSLTDLNIAVQYVDATIFVRD